MLYYAIFCFESVLEEPKYLSVTIFRPNPANLRSCFSCHVQCSYDGRSIFRSFVVVDVFVRMSVFGELASSSVHVHSRTPSIVVDWSVGWLAGRLAGRPGINYVSLSAFLRPNKLLPKWKLGPRIKKS